MLNDSRESGAGAPTPGAYAELFFKNDPATMKAEATYFVGRGAKIETVRTEFARFCHHWMERTPGGKKQLWQTKKTFEVRRRLVTWFDRIVQRASQQGRPPAVIISSPSPQ